MCSPTAMFWGPVDSTVITAACIHCKKGCTCLLLGGCTHTPCAARGGEGGGYMRRRGCCDCARCDPRVVADGWEREVSHCFTVFEQVAHEAFLTLYHTVCGGEGAALHNVTNSKATDSKKNVFVRVWARGGGHRISHVKQVWVQLVSLIYSVALLFGWFLIDSYDSSHTSHHLSERFLTLQSYDSLISQMTLKIFRDNLHDSRHAT